MRDLGGAGRHPVHRHFSAAYIVPLYALIQARTDEDKRARVIAANNILNALFMVAAALVSILFLSVAKLSILITVPRPCR